MDGQIALGLHQKYLNLFSKDEWRLYGFETTWGWVINDRIVIFGWTIPLSDESNILFCFLVKKDQKKFIKNTANYDSFYLFVSDKLN